MGTEQLPPAPAGKNRGRLGSLLRYGAVAVISLGIGVAIGSASTEEPSPRVEAATSPSPTATETAAATPSPEATPEPEPEPSPEVSYRLERSRIHLSLKTTERQCFGSAGCLVTVEVRAAVEDKGLLPNDGVWDVTYQITGDEDGPIIGTFELLGKGTYEVNEELVSTPSVNVEPRVKVVSVEQAAF